MASKRSRQVSDDTPVGGEDFKLINSISWKMENRLHRVGITTYAQIAALTPTEIAGRLGNPSGLSERIAKENWAGQARELADLTARSKPQTKPDSAATTEGAQRFETFATELLLTADNRVLHTRVMHVPSGDEELWGDWDEQRLVNFFAHQAGFPPAAKARASKSKSGSVKGKSVTSTRALPDEPAAPEVGVIEITAEELFTKPVADGVKVTTPQPPDTALAKSAPLPVARIPLPTIAAENTASHKLEFLTAESETPTRLLRSGQPFTARILLNLVNVVAGDNPLDYTATIQASSLTGHQAQTTRQARGRILPGENAVLDVKGLSLEPGAYRLAATTVFNPATDKSSTMASSLNFQVEGGVIQVY
ncbi:MAG: hypothetical protein AAB401_05135 [Acidobacteriota bacterium]